MIQAAPSFCSDSWCCPTSPHFYVNTTPDFPGTFIWVVLYPDSCFSSCSMPLKRSDSGIYCILCSCAETKVIRILIWIPFDVFVKWYQEAGVNVQVMHYLWKDLFVLIAFAYWSRNDPLYIKFPFVLKWNILLKKADMYWNPGTILYSSEHPCLRNLKF